MQNCVGSSYSLKYQLALYTDLYIYFAIQTSGETTIIKPVPLGFESKKQKVPAHESIFSKGTFRSTISMCKRRLNTSFEKSKLQSFHYCFVYTLYTYIGLKKKQAISTFIMLSFTFHMISFGYFSKNSKCFVILEHVNELTKRNRIKIIQV